MQVLRDVASDPVPHLDGARFSAFVTPAANRVTRSQQAVIAHSDALIAELKSADVVVLGLPMYNFGVPSQLKSYFDHIARAGETFKLHGQRPGRPGHWQEGLRVRRPVAACMPAPRSIAETSYVRDFLRFIGLDDVEFVYAEGLAISAGAEGSRPRQGPRSDHQVLQPEPLHPTLNPQPALSPLT